MVSKLKRVIDNVSGRSLHDLSEKNKRRLNATERRVGRQIGVAETGLTKRINSIEKGLGALRGDDDKASGEGTVRMRIAELEAQVRLLRGGLTGSYRSEDPSRWQDVQFFDSMLKRHGCLRSTAAMTADEKFDLNQWFQYKEKSEVALTVASSFYEGDYFEFGSTDVNTFRNILSAFNIYGLRERFPDTRFYGFDIFGRTDEMTEETRNQLEAAEGYTHYLSMFSARGDLLEENWKYLRDHNIDLDKCHLVQGYFEETLTEEFKKKLLGEGRKISFACLDCNIAPPYKIVFEFIFDLMAPYSYIYMDEYSSGAVQNYFRQFSDGLREHRGIGTFYMRNAGGFGGLFGLYPLVDAGAPLQLRPAAAKDTAHSSEPVMKIGG